MRRLLLCLGLLLAATGSCLAGPKADLSEFYRRLESLGLETEWLRGLVGEITVRYRSRTSDAEAEWGFIRDVLSIPEDYSEEDSDRIRYDLSLVNLDTVIHELTHASRDKRADREAARGTPEQAHGECLEAVWADLFQDPNQRFLGVPRYPRAKADEVLSYFMGKSIADLFAAADAIVTYNSSVDVRLVASEAEARSLGGAFRLPPAAVVEGERTGPAQSLSRKVYSHTLWRQTVVADAHFKSSNVTRPKLIRWDEAGRDWVKQEAYRGILGLKPPGTLEALVARMNELDRPWLDEVRELLAERRLEFGRKNEAAGRSVADVAAGLGLPAPVAPPLPAGDGGRPFGLD